MRAKANDFVNEISNQEKSEEMNKYLAIINFINTF